MLVDKAAEVLTREHIRSQRLPNGANLEFDHAINTAVEKLRVALWDLAEKPDYIQRVAPRGYRLIVPANPPERRPPASAPQSAALADEDFSIGCGASSF